MDHGLIEIFDGEIHYNQVVRKGNPQLNEYVTNKQLESWCNGLWISCYTLTIF